MTEKWRRYETLMIFGADLGVEGTEALVQKVRDYITQDGGRILKTERWGLRDLAFELKGHSRGYYLLLEYAGLPRVATEVDRKLNLIDSIVKFQSVKLAEDVDPATLPETEEIVAAPELKTAPMPEPRDSDEGARAEGEESGDSD
ncbi:MAG: 30S ribosomal protein S6 [Deltaproteobacteria bacterium]|nr:30S ribosomal protein S6 [Deltaproteobacteria bacterium]